MRSEAASLRRNAKQPSSLPGSKGARVTDGHLARPRREHCKTGEHPWKQQPSPVPCAPIRDRRDGRVRRLTTETKQAFKTTEFWAMVGVVVAILVSAAAIKGGDTNGTDEFIARQAWLYVAIVAGAYFIVAVWPSPDRAIRTPRAARTVIGTVASAAWQRASLSNQRPARCTIPAEALNEGLGRGNRSPRNRDTKGTHDRS